MMDARSLRLAVKEPAV